MNMKTRIILLAVLPLVCSQAAETAVWDTANNRVTYSVFVDNLTLSSTIASHVSLSQFSSAAVVSEEGGSAAQYTLSKAILSIDGTIYGTVWFQNNDTEIPGRSATPTFSVNGGGSKLTFGSQTTLNETFFDVVEIGSVAAGLRVDTSVNVPGSGAVSQTYIDDALAAFIGTGNISTDVIIKGSGAFYVEGISASASGFDLKGAANVSVTYEYTYSDVPEPTSLALLGLGCMALLARRRFKKTV